MAHSILFVDDERDLVRSAEIFLTEAGYNFKAAYDGIEALACIAESTPDLMILDITMPRLNGWDVLRMMQADPKKAAIPVLVLTARSKEAEQNRGWELGATWYQPKPFNFEELLLVIDRILTSVDDSPDE